MDGELGDNHGLFDMHSRPDSVVPGRCGNPLPLLDCCQREEAHLNTARSWPISSEQHGSQHVLKDLAQCSYQHGRAKRDAT